jgi:hypothetical protein
MSHAQYAEHLSKNAKMNDKHRKGSFSSAGTKGSSSSVGTNDSFHSSPPPPIHQSSGNALDTGYGSPLDTSPLRLDDEPTLPDLKGKQRETYLSAEEAFANFKLRPDSPAPRFGYGTNKPPHMRPIPFPPALGLTDRSGKVVSLNDPRSHNNSFLNRNFFVDESVMGTPPISPFFPGVGRHPGQPAQVQPAHGYWGRLDSHVPATQPAQYEPAQGCQYLQVPPTHLQSRDAGAIFPPHPNLPEVDQQSQRQTRRQSTDQVFRPMHAAMARLNLQSSLGSPHPPTRHPPIQANPMEKVMLGFSPNYMGNIHIDKNKSANIPEDENCSLWLTGLPPAITYTQLLSAIRGIGRVYQTHINLPEPEKGHYTAACKVVFFDRPSAQRFWDRYGPGGFCVRGFPEVGRVAWNRVRSAAIEGPNAKKLSRVLLISGPPQLVNTYFLTQYFQSKLEFNVDVIINHQSDDEHRALVEYRFASFRCQAESAKMAISREMWAHNVQVWFWNDPCDVDGESQEGGAEQVFGASAGVGPATYRHPAHVAKSWRQQ